MKRGAGWLAEYSKPSGAPFYFMCSICTSVVYSPLFWKTARTVMLLKSYLFCRPLARSRKRIKVQRLGVNTFHLTSDDWQIHRQRLNACNKKFYACVWSSELSTTFWGCLWEISWVEELFSCWGSIRTRCFGVNMKRVCLSLTWTRQIFNTGRKLLNIITIGERYTWLSSGRA